jgi:hypothetical protein
MPEPRASAGDHLGEASHVIFLWVHPLLRLGFNQAVRLVTASSTAHCIGIGEDVRSIAQRLQALPGLGIRRPFGESRQGSSPESVEHAMRTMMMMLIAPDPRIAAPKPTVRERDHSFSHKAVALRMHDGLVSPIQKTHRKPLLAKAGKC